MLAAAQQGLVEIICYNQWPRIRLRSLLCLVQCGFPLLSAVVLCLGLRKDSVSNLEVTMRWASVADCVSGTIKLLRCGGLADRAKEGPGQRSILDHALSLLRIISSKTSRYNVVGRGISHKRGIARCYRENERDGSARPIRMLRLVFRIFWLCQLGMGIDPISSILLGSKFPKMVHGLIRPHYLHAPNLAVLQWR
jgi:hypothetical protein